MTQEAFIKVLEEKGYSYEMMGDSVVVNGGDRKGNVDLLFLTSLPPGVVFKNGGFVGLEDHTSLPSGVVFKNGGFVSFGSLTSLPTDVVFKNGGFVSFGSLTSLPTDVVFKNEGDISFKSLEGEWFSNWKGNIEGIDSKRLLNMMISKGIFER